MADHIITQRGTVKVSGKSGATYELRADFNALCDIEEAIGKPLSDLDLGSVSLRDVRAIVRALAGMAADTEAGDAIGDVGIQAMSEAMGAALSVGMGVDPADGTPTADPPSDPPGEA